MLQLNLILCFGRWNSQFYYLFIYVDYYVIVTDVIVTRPDVFKANLFILSLWFMMLIEPCGCQGVTRALVLSGCYLSLSSDLTNTSSHICSSWYLPIFLFRDGSLTLINMPL